MADNSLAGFGKDPLVTSHGDALADQSFQSLKSKEIRDSLSPTEMKFQAMALNNPNTTGWNVQSAKEISPDGRGFRAETVATTDGVENINGGTAEFRGRNEERSSAHHQGDDKNFVKKAMESSNSHLQEKVVIGDENSGRTEVRTRSSTSTSSSQIIQSSTNVEYDDGYPIQQQPHAQKYLIDSKGLNQHQQQDQQRLLEEQHIYEQQRQQHLMQQERHATEQVSTKRQNIEQKNISQNIETQETHEQNKRYVDMDKASPEYQQHVQYLMQQPGEIISSTVEYPKPNVKMITTVKRLPDGTIVRNKRYETEELTPNTNNNRPTSTPTNQTHPRRDSQHQQPKINYQPHSSAHSTPSQNMVDSSNSRYVQDTHSEDLETKFSSIKKSSNKFSTETTSETMQEEFDEHHPQGKTTSRPKPKSNDFSTHGFPSVRANKPTQEYPSERPRTTHPTQGHPTQASPSRPTEFDTFHNTDDTDNITERRINTKDGEVIIISSEKKHNFKTSTNSERIVETEHVIHEDQPYQQIPDKRTQDFTTHGFPSVREPSSHQTKNYPNEKQMQPQEQDFPLDKSAPGTRIIKGVHAPHGDEEVFIVSSQKSHTAKHSSNTERVIAHEIVRDGQPVGYPHTDNNAPYNYTVTTPGDQTPQVEILGSPRKPSNADYSTQGFPSVRNPNYVKPGEREPLGDHPAETSRRPNNEYSSEKIPSRPAAGLPSSHNQHPNSPRKSPGQDYSPQGYPSVRSPTRGTPTQTYPTNVDGRRTPGTVEQPKTATSGKVQTRTPSPNKYKASNTTVRETTERVIKKEKEVDSAHRAFAASLRSSSPIDHIRRDSYTTDSHTRHTPRSSVSSTRTFRRDMREGSHDSAPSETSRISTTTITRNTPPRTVGGRTVTSKVVTTKTGPGSKESLNVTTPRATKSPSPSKNVTSSTTTTTTTTRTLNREVPKVTEKTPVRKQSSQPAPNSRSSTPSFNSSRKPPPKSVMANDYDDDDDNLNTTSPFSQPSSRSRTPQNASSGNDKPQDDWQMPSRQPDSDERRTVNREITFEKTTNESTQPRKPNFEQPNVEWVLADDDDDYHHDHDHDYDDYDNDNFTPEVVDANLNIKKTTTKLITQEKKSPVVSQRVPKPITTTTRTTITSKHFANIPSKSPNKTNEKSPLKTKPNDCKAPQSSRTPKPLTDSKSPIQTSSKFPTKVMDSKTLPKSPKSNATSNTSPLRKPLPKTTTEETNLRKTLKTSQVLKEKTNKLIEAEKPKPKPQSPQRITKPQTPNKRKPNEVENDETIVVTEITERRLTDRKSPQSGHVTARPHDNESEPIQASPEKIQFPTADRKSPEVSPGFRKPQDNDLEQQKISPAYRKPQDDDNEPKPISRKPEDISFEPKPGSPNFKSDVYTNNETIHYSEDTQIPLDADKKLKIKSPVFRKPPSSGFQKLQSTFDERSSQYRKPYPIDDEPYKNSPVVSNSPDTYMKPEDTNEKPRRVAPKRPDSKPIQQQNPQGDTPGYRRPKASNKPNHDLPSYENSTAFKPNQDKKYSQKIFEEEITTVEKYANGVPENRVPQRRQHSPENITVHLTSRSGKQYEIDEKREESKIRLDYRGKPVESDEEPGSPKPEFEPSKSYDDDDDDVGLTDSENIVLSSQRTVAKNIQKFETNFLKNKSPKPENATKFPIKQPKTPAVKETTGSKSPKRVISPSRTPKEREEIKHVSQSGPQERLKQKSPTQPANKRPKSPSKQAGNKPHEEMPLDDEYITINSKITKVITEKLIENLDDEEYPEHQPRDHKSKTSKPLKMDDDDDDNEVLTTSTQKIFKKPLYPEREFPDNKPQQKPNEKLPGRRAQSPTKQVSPLRTSVDNQTLRKTLNTAADKTTRKVVDKKYPTDKYPLKKEYQPQTTDTEEEKEETFTETNEFIIKSTQKEFVAEQQTQEFKESSKSPTRRQSKPNEKEPEEKLKQPISKRPQSPSKHVSPTRILKKSEKEITSEDDKTTKIVKEQIIRKGDDQKFPKPGHKSPTRETIKTRSQSPNKSPSPTRNQMRNVTTRNYTTENITKDVDHKPKDKPKDLKPQYANPLDNEDEDSVTLNSERFVSSKTCKITERTLEPQYPNRDELSTQNITECKFPQEPEEKYPTGKKADTEIFKISLKATKTVTENTAQNVDQEQYPNNNKPSDRKPVNLEDKTLTSLPQPLQPGFMKPKEKRPQSPPNEAFIESTQKFKKEDQTVRETTKIVVEKSTEDTTEHEEKPKSHEPTETDKNESFMETAEFVLKATKKPKYPGLHESVEKPQQLRPGFKETNDDETFDHTNEFIRNTTKKLITNEQSVETEQDLYYANKTRQPNKDSSPKGSYSPQGKKNPTDFSKYPEDRKQSPTRKPKSVTVDDETFKKSLRNEKVKPKEQQQQQIDLLKHSDRDKEESDNETEDLLIETCEKNYVIERNFTSEKEQEPKVQKPKEKKSKDTTIEIPLNKSFDNTCVETIEGQTYPEDTELFPVTNKHPKNKMPSKEQQEPQKPTQTTKYSINVNEQFIETERLQKETPDGGFISKTLEPSTPTSPTYKKKGAGRSDTFEERCRHILGMETYGDTPGVFKKQPLAENEEKEGAKESKEIPEKTTIFQVKVEDCDEDDEVLSISSVQKTLHKQIHTTEQTLKEETEDVGKPVETSQSKNPKNKIQPDEKFTNTLEKEADKPQEKTTEPKIKEASEPITPIYQQGDKNEFVQITTETTTVHGKTTQNKSDDEIETDFSEPEFVEKKFVKETKIIKKPSSTSSPRSSSPTKIIASTRSLSPNKKTSSPKNETPKRKPKTDSFETKSLKKITKNFDDTTTIKDRLRSSTRKTKSPTKLDQIDGSESESPEHSPTRFTERRRSSNISVTTEIIIEHTDSDTANKKEKSPPPIITKSQEGSSVYKAIIDSTVMPEKLTRRLPVTERKESAPVHRVTSKDKDSKMSRSTSENLIKIKKSEPHSISPKTPTKITDHRRPNKCFATKSINLSATDRLEDMANVVIDIQHAKSSREPSPDKIVPTPVPANLDTGKPRYPDVVQEPEDEQPKRKPQVKNIPIFEEENNSFIGCHTTEVNVDKSYKTTYDSLDYEKEILKNPVVEAPSSLEYISLDKTSEGESLLTVQEKVTKFQNITRENINKKLKAQEPIHPQTQDINLKSQYDEYLVTEKIEKVKEENYEDDYEVSRNDYDLTTTKLAPTAPQKSPELVRTISRHISRQTEPDANNEANETNKDYPLTTQNVDSMECLINNKQTTKEFKVSHHQHHLNQTTTEIETANTAGKYQQPQGYNDHDDDNELIPHTATHTTIIEERRQKDILNRPSVFENRNNKNPTATNKTPLKCNKSPVKETEKLRPDIKSRTNTTYADNNNLAEQNTQTATKKQTTKTVTELANKPKQRSPQRKNSDFDYELSDCNDEMGRKNFILKQTKVYNSNNNNNNDDNGSDSKVNDFKKLTTSNKKPEKHMSVRLTAAKNSDAHESIANNEMIITSEEERNDTDIETQVINEETNRQTSNKKHSIEEEHSSTNSSPTEQSLKTNLKKVHVDKLTDKNPFKKSNTPSVTTTSTSIKINETNKRADHIDETVLEPTTKKSPVAHPSTKHTKMSTTATDSVAARRSLFESNNVNNGTTSATPTKRTPLTSPMSGRRPSYMDHTKSSLEHTRRDSLEINKTNYLRKPSHPEQEGEEVTGNERNSTVKFVDVPHGKRATTPRATSVSEDINIEEIFDLEVLEKLLETVQSYEIRRRIRAQIRLIKKNQRNEMISSSTTEVTTSSVRTLKVDNEEPDTVTVNKRKPKLENKTNDEITEAKEVTSHKSSKKEYIFEEAYHPTTRRSPKPKRYPYQEEEEEEEEQKKEPAGKPVRNQSPQSPERQRSAAERERHISRDQQRQHHTSRTTKQHYHYHSEQEQDEVNEIRHETSPNRKSPSPSRKVHSSSTSPERRYTSPETKTNERNRSPQTSRITSSRSPDNKTLATAVRKTSASYEQQETVKSSNNKIQTKRITPTTTTATTTKAKPEDKTPVWADRKNILKAPSISTTPKKPSVSTLDNRTGYTKTMKSTTSQKMMTSSHQTSFVDDDCVTSSYGIGPTDENGLPLFGIRALKKKKSPVEPSETTEEVTGYVVEEKYYSDNKTKPTVERKEFIYSTNPEELQKLKQEVEVKNNRKSLKDVELKETRQAALISKTTPALRSSPEDDFLDSTTKYVRRGSVKEMSEKFIQKEASSTVTEKTNNYPKAGLILRTNSRKSSRDMDNENNEHFESYKTTRVQQQQQHHTSSALADSDDAEQEYQVEEFASRHHSGHFVTESESECDSIKTQREFKKVTSSCSSSMATRSFLNSQGEEKVVTNVSDCLERMRNADNVVEEGDTADDQEARALLNKFLGASIIMKGVESSLPAATNRQTKIITTTTTSSNLSDNNDKDDDDDDADNNAKHEVKTTRITKTIKSGNSSTPVTHTTCDIEEIWDEEILKELLEQARTYEERRKIRSRLRELMADREEQKQQKSSSSTTEKSETKEKDGAVVTTTTKVTTRTVTGSAAKPVTPFAKFKQLDKQNSQQSAKSPTTPTTPGGGSTASPSSGSQAIFKFTDPALNAKAATVKEQLLQWCQSKTQEYENIEITNFSTSWNNGLAFCALIHHFLPDAFDYSQLTPKNRRKNFELAFTVADEKAGIAPLLDVEDMVVMQRPDWKCVFVYVQSIYRRFRNCQ